MGSGGLVAPCQEEVFGAGRAIALLMTAETLRHDTCNVSSGRPGSLKARNLRRDPRMALSIAPADNPFQPVVVRGRVEEWLDGDAAWEIVDQLATKYTGAPYPREQERVVAVIEPERQTVRVR